MSISIYGETVGIQRSWLGSFVGEDRTSVQTIFSELLAEGCRLAYQLAALLWSGGQGNPGYLQALFVVTPCRRILSAVYDWIHGG